MKITKGAIEVQLGWMGVCFKVMPHDNDLCNDIVDDATSMMEFNDCDDIIQARHVNLRRYCYNCCIPSLRKSLSCGGIAFSVKNV